MLKRTAIAAALLGALLSMVLPPSVQATEIALRGAQSCLIWTKGRAQDDARYEKAWLAGYFSGLAIGLDVNFWGIKGRNEIESDAVWKWIDDYCATNPKKHLIHAAEQLFIKRFPIVTKPAN